MRFIDHPPGSPEWTRDIFERAYCRDGGPFERVHRRLRHGFSVLVYLPGSCVNAAAQFVKDNAGKGRAWEEYGNHPGPGQSMEVAWTSTSNFLKSIAEFFQNPHRPMPNAVYKNLDRLFFDNNDGVIQNPSVQLALFSLVESIRSAAT